MTTGIVLREGFDTYNGTSASVGLGSRWAIYGPSELVAGRLGGQALRVNTVPDSIGGGVDTPLDSNVTEFALGIAVRIPNGFYPGQPSQSQICLKTQASGLFNGMISGLKFELDGGISLHRLANGGTSEAQLGIAPALTMVPGVWHYLEWEGKLASDGTGFGRVYLNGDPEPVLEVIEANTARAGVTIAGRIQLGTPNSIGLLPTEYDDFYVRNTPVRLGQRRIETTEILGNGAHQDSVPSSGTDRAALIDESQANAADYVTFTNVGDYDEYTIQPLDGNASVIDEVTIIAYAQKTDAATRAMNLGLDESGFVSNGADIYLASGVGKYTRSLPLNPNGDINWTRADVEGIILRPRVAV